MRFVMCMYDACPIWSLGLRGVICLFANVTISGVGFIYSSDATVLHILLVVSNSWFFNLWGEGTFWKSEDLSRFNAWLVTLFDLLEVEMAANM